jgi:hypothetical protein
VQQASNVEYQVETGSEKIVGEVIGRNIDMQEPYVHSAAVAIVGDIRILAAVQVKDPIPSRVDHSF